MTDAVDVALPPMPEPEGGKLRYDHTGSLLPEPSFSADQVRAYAIQAVMAERERLVEQLTAMDCAHRCGVGHEFAAAIRAQSGAKA